MKEESAQDLINEVELTEQEQVDVNISKICRRDK